MATWQCWWEPGGSFGMGMWIREAEIIGHASKGSTFLLLSATGKWCDLTYAFKRCVPSEVRSEVRGAKLVLGITVTTLSSFDCIESHLTIKVTGTERSSPIWNVLWLFDCRWIPCWMWNKRSCLALLSVGGSTWVNSEVYRWGVCGQGCGLMPTQVVRTSWC